jgi:hypothetical protein
MCMTQRLKGLISSCEVVGSPLKPYFDKLEGFLNPTVKGTLFEHAPQVFQGEECHLERDVLKYLEELVAPNESQDATKARRYKNFGYHGAIFSPDSFSVRDSYVVIRRGSGTQIPGDWYAGTIKQIFTYPFNSSARVYFVIQKFRELSSHEASRDPYRQFPLVGGRLYHTELEDKIEVIPSQRIISHFAHTPHDRQDFGFPCFHALPLDKVSTHPPHHTPAS